MGSSVYERLDGIYCTYICFPTARNAVTTVPGALLRVLASLPLIVPAIPRNKRNGSLAFEQIAALTFAKFPFKAGWPSFFGFSAADIKSSLAPHLRRLTS